MRRAFAADEIDEMIQAVIAVIDNPEFASFFAASSLAEVPFAASLGEPLGTISGQIDRLVVTEEEIFILDFKTDREPPATPQSVSLAYIAQLAAYRAGLARIFPGRSIRAGLLWTEVPVLMELPDAQMEAASAAYHNPVSRP